MSKVLNAPSYCQWMEFVCSTLQEPQGGAAGAIIGPRFNVRGGKVCSTAPPTDPQETLLEQNSLQLILWQKIPRLKDNLIVRSYTD